MERPSPAAGHDRVSPAYERHRPEQTVLYGVVQAELESFLARERDRPLPRFVERELRVFLECGILAPAWRTTPFSLRWCCGSSSAECSPPTAAVPGNAVPSGGSGEGP